MPRKPILPTDAEEAAITAGALADPDNPLLTDNDLAGFRRARGRPRKSSPKVQVSIRYSAEVVEFFRASGEGWQARMDAVLKEYVASHR